MPGVVVAETPGGEPVLVAHPDADRHEAERLAAAGGLRVAGLEEVPLARGRLLEAAHAERYPTIRWHFPWEGYVAAGVPDGLTDDLVYEFKTTRSRQLLHFTRSVGMAQADLYGYFFRRPRKRVQYLLVEEGTTLTWEQDVDRAYAEDLLARFAAAAAGAPPPPPRPWKCRSCVFRPECPICPLDRRTDR